MKAAGDIGKVDVRHQRHVIAHVIEAKALTHVAIDCHAHA
jgi:hypothetical protein